MPSIANKQGTSCIDGNADVSNVDVDADFTADVNADVDAGVNADINADATSIVASNGPVRPKGTIKT